MWSEDHPQFFDEGKIILGDDNNYVSVNYRTVSHAVVTVVIPTDNGPIYWATCSISMRHNAVEIFLAQLAFRGATQVRWTTVRTLVSI